MVSLTGISSGDVTTLSAVSAGSESSSTIQSVWLRTGPTVHELLDRGRGVELADHVTGRGGVDDDEIPVGAAGERLAELPADLADGEDLLHARRGGGDEVEGARERADAPEHRDLAPAP